jgi:Pirin C-terminal cupin domain
MSQSQNGPFVMNTQEEIFNAIDDYQNGRLSPISDALLRDDARLPKACLMINANSFTTHF